MSISVLVNVLIAYPFNNIVEPCTESGLGHIRPASLISFCNFDDLSSVKLSGSPKLA
jgi:hypothetical protein